MCVLLLFFCIYYVLSSVEINDDYCDIFGTWCGNDFPKHLSQWKSHSTSASFVTKSENYGRKLHLRPLKTLHCFIISNSLCIGAELNGRHAVWMVAVKCCRICVCYIRERRHRWQSGRRSLSRHQQQNGLYANFSFIIPSELIASRTKKLVIALPFRV